MLTGPSAKILSLYLILSLFALTLPAQGWAMFLPSGPAPAERTADLAHIQKTLESRVIKQRLMEYGLSAEETMVNVSALSDEQVHQLAKNMDSVQAGGDAVGAVIFLLLVAIIVVVVLQATGHEIVIKK